MSLTSLQTLTCANCGSHRTAQVGDASIYEGRPRRTR